MNLKHLFLAFFSIIIFAACEHQENDIEAPILTIDEPTEGQSISGEVHIHGKVTDASLHELEIKVTKDADGSDVFKANPTVHDETMYDFEEHFTPSGLTGETPVTLTITVEDHSSNVTTKTVKFKINP
jgi:type 1 fimbria pilin